MTGARPGAPARPDRRVGTISGVACPPAGTDWIGVVAEPLPVTEAVAWAGRPGCGAVVTFCGTVRDHSPGRPGVTRLAYEAYHEQAEPRLAAVAAAARARWPEIGRVALLHRVGELAVGEAAVVVVVSSPHRDAAFEAARFSIDTLKSSVPIWKHETWDGGSGWGCCDHDLVDLEAVAGAAPVSAHGGLVPLEAARAHVMGHCRALPPAEVPVAGAGGLVLARSVVAGHDVPPFANSAMDGYAVRAADVAGAPVALVEVGGIMAGDAPRTALGAGEAVRIMTGAPVPPGADAVCKVEDTEPGPDGTVVVRCAAVVGEHVRLAGEDVAVGEEVFAPGTVLGPAAVGVLASLGVDAVVARPRPRVAVLATGDELASGPGALAPGKIRDANRPALLAQLERDRLHAVDLGRVGDDAEQVARAIAGAAGRADAVVVTGGVSVGDRDVVKDVLASHCGPTMRWMQVAIKPAKPFAFGMLADTGTPVFGLPGNPVSALVSYELFVRPALRALAGHPSPGRPRLRAVAGSAFRRHRDGKLHLVRVVAAVDREGTLVARAAGGQGSHQLRAMATANALALVPDGDGVAAGEPVEVVLLDPDGPAIGEQSWPT